ncbi:MAG: AbgT family transporter, partial [Vallitaleaceae bacterium]|nr:AbgT family transporter [Vallitaleaceae bacterium]
LSTASVIFLPIGFMAAEILGYDKMAGVALVALGTNAGFAAGVFNPFTVGLAQGYAQLPIFSGAWLRWILLVTILFATIVYILFYTKKIKKNNIQTIVADGKLTLRQWIELAIYISAFVYLMIGIQNKGYKVADIAVILVSLSIIIGIIHGFHYNEICNLLVRGARKMMTGVFVIGLASTMRLILTKGQVLDSIAFHLLELASGGSELAVLLAMFYGNALFDLVVTSGTAHGAVAVPIMLPLADYAGISRQSTVFAFQLGDGLVNLVSPLSTTLTGILAFSEISYGKWIRFFLPLVGIYMIIGTFFIWLAHFVSY